MKWLAALLIVANLLFYGYSQLAQPPAEDWRARQLNADKVRLQTGEPAPAAKEKPAEAAAEAANPEAAPAATDIAAKAEADKAAAAKAAQAAKAEASKVEAAKAAQAAKAEADKVAAKVCLIWNGLNSQEFGRAKVRLAKLGLRAEEEAPSGNGKFWIYIPPRDNLADAQHKASELKALGVSDYFVVNDGSKWQNAVSLGLFSQRDGAERRMSELKEQGVKSAVLRERNDGVHAGKFRLQQLNAEQAGKVKTLAGAFAGSELNEEACR